MEEKERIQLLADQLQSFLVIVDSFVDNLTDDDYKLLEESKETLESNISFRESAATLTMAFGIEQDTTEERYKIKTLDSILNLLNTRKEYRSAMIEKQERDKRIKENREQIMNLFGIGG